MTLIDALAEAAADLAGVEATRADGAIEWAVDGRSFAAATQSVADFRLPTMIARAALGTPDTGPSRRGRAWIAFTPQELDRFALDRATAWFGSAYRHASPDRD